LFERLRVWRKARADEDEVPHPDELTHALEAVSEARVRLTELLLVVSRCSGAAAACLSAASRG